LPAQLPPTVYGRYGNWIVAFLYAFLVLTLSVVSRRRI